MKKHVISFFLCCLMIATYGIASACSLPAEPSAAAVPSKGEAEVVTKDGKIFYVVPQGKSMKLNIVWDPATHVDGKATTPTKWDGVKKAGFAVLSNVETTDAYGYFKLSEMAEFFGVKGNRQSAAEAFSKMAGFPLPSTGFMSDYGMGASEVLGNFANGSADRLYATDDPVDEYDGSSIVNGASPLSGVLVNDDIDLSLPAANPQWNKETITLPDGTPVKVSPTDDSKVKIEIQNSGLFIKNLKVDVSNIEESDYKVYEETGTTDASKAYVKGLKSGPIGFSGGDSPTNGQLDVGFYTPTISGNNLDNCMKRVRVYAPPAGFELTNWWWAWEEQKYENVTVTETHSEQDKDSAGNLLFETDGAPVMVLIKTTKVEWQKKELEKCSYKLMLIVIKEPKKKGYAGYVVYDSSPPIASTLTIDEGKKWKFSKDGSSNVPFTMEVLDSNPFAPIESNVIDGHPVSPVSATTNPLLFYSYPYYDYTKSDNLKIADLKSGYGLADFSTKESGKEGFKSYKYVDKWAWKKVIPQITSISKGELLTNGDGKLVGSTFIIKGNMKVEINPWHSCNDPDPSVVSAAKNVAEKSFKVFGITKDTVGLSNQAYDDVSALAYPLAKDILAGGESFACKPGSNVILAANQDDPNYAALTNVANVDKAQWQTQDYIYSVDKIAPEIEVFVFDTRTNKFHVFGTKENTDAEFTNFGDTDPGLAGFAYSPTEDYPYKGHEKDPVKFTILNDELFDYYFSKGKSTVEDGTKDGFVCQKNTRLIFYIRAFDNINTFDVGKKYGVAECSYSIVDKDLGVPSGDPNNGNIASVDMPKAINHQFRYEDMAGNHYLEVKAKDFSKNERIFTLKIGVKGRTLGIRTLEERRNREN